MSPPCKGEGKMQRKESLSGNQANRKWVSGEQEGESKIKMQKSKMGRERKKAGSNKLTALLF